MFYVQACRPISVKTIYCVENGRPVMRNNCCYLFSSTNYLLCFAEKEATNPQKKPIFITKRTKGCALHTWSWHIIHKSASVKTISLSIICRNCVQFSAFFQLLILLSHSILSGKQPETEQKTNMKHTTNISVVAAFE